MADATLSIDFIIDKYTWFIYFLKAFDTEQNVRALLHSIFWAGIVGGSLADGYLVILRYCELSVTEFLLVFFFFYVSLFSWAYAHALKSFFLFVCFYYFIHCLTICCFIGFPLASLLVKSIHVKRVYWTQPPYAVERGAPTHLRESLVCLFMFKTLYKRVFFFTSLFLLTVISHRDHIVERLSQNATLLVSIVVFLLITIR